MLGDSLMELAQYDAANDAYQEMISLGANLASYNRIAYHRFVTGKRDEALKEFRRCIDRGAELEERWQRDFDAYAKANPAEAADFKAALAGELPRGWDADLPVFTPKDSLATRESASRAEQAIAKRVPALFGGSADLNESTFTDIRFPERGREPLPSVFFASKPDGKILS